MLVLAVLRAPGGTGGLSLYQLEAREMKLRPSVLNTPPAPAP